MIALEHGLTDPGPDLLAEAWGLPVARRYRHAGLLTQTPAAMCGPTSIALALRSAGLEAQPRSVLEGTSVRTVFGARLGGLSLDQVTEALAVRSGREAVALRDLSLDDFRAELRRSNDPHYRYVANFNRQPLFGWGGGHHSPIGGYLEDADAALVIDVNARVGPFLVSAPQLHRAVCTRDPWMDRPRGLARLHLPDAG